jgi:hypothetical protein
MSICKFGHISVQATKAVANALNWKLTDNSKICKACADDKTKQWNATARAQTKPSSKGKDRIFLDI